VNELNAHPSRWVFSSVKDLLQGIINSGLLWSTGDYGFGQLCLGTGTVSTVVWTKAEVMDGGTAVTFKKIASLLLDSDGQL
jgi:hypothetical protein